MLVAMRANAVRFFTISILFALWPGAILAQTTVPVPFPDLYKSITDYLGLSPEQRQAIRAAADPSQQEYYRLADRQDELADLIFEETGKVVLQPSELGRLHTERETNRRRMVDLQQQSRQATRAVLTEAQLVKLDLLEQIPQLRDPASQATSLGLIPDNDCVQKIASFGSFSIYLGLPVTCQPPQLPWLTSIPEFGPPRPGDEYLPTGELRFYPHLVRYLDLTPDQQERIEGNRTQAFAADQTERIRTVSNEIIVEMAKPQIDSIGLGIRYAEIETRRRLMWDSIRRLNDQNLAVLTPIQRAKYEALAEAVRLKRAVDEAQSTYLMGMRCQQQVSLFSGSREDPLDFGLFNIYLGDCVDSRALDELR